jgi:3-oxoacyl-[acyl-carrier-protein] synthase II
MLAALREARLAPSDIGYINAHATSTPLGDVIEARAIKALFGHRTAVSSNKGALGHLLGAAGAVEAMFTVLSLKHQVAPHTLNLAVPGEGIELDLVTNAPRNMKMRYALSNSFGFGGTNASLCFAAEA